MIDTLLHNLEKITSIMEITSRNKIEVDTDTGYGIITLHRPSNVDDPEVLGDILRTLSDISINIPLFFPVHPRTAQKIKNSNLQSILESGNIICTGALAYLDLLGLMRKARLVLTDSGGIQEETTALGIPCITLRENTERPITISQGTNTLAGIDRQKIMAAVEDVFINGGKIGRVPELWDGHAAERIVAELNNWL